MEKYLLLKKAEEGNIEAQLELGYLYYYGDDTNKRYRKFEIETWEPNYHSSSLQRETQNIDNAKKWYTKAAEQNNAEAQFMLGYLYNWDIEVEGRYKIAKKWYTKAAEQGNAFAQATLGLIYSGRLSILEQNHKEAVKWYTKAAEQGNVYSQFNLGCLYYYREKGGILNRLLGCIYYYIGKGIKPNRKEAIKWLEKVVEYAKEKNSKSEYDIDILYSDISKSYLRDYGIEEGKSDKNIKKIGKYVFISYSSKNQSMADATRMLLKEHSIPYWMAPYDIPAGSKYAYVINDALENCVCLLLLLTNDSQNSPHVEREVERAVNYKKPIITMQLEDVILNSGFKYFIGSEQIVAVHNIDENNSDMQKIIKGIKVFVLE